jgi:hypothetical protein
MKPGNPVEGARPRQGRWFDSRPARHESAASPGAGKKNRFLHHRHRYISIKNVRKMPTCKACRAKTRINSISFPNYLSLLSLSVYRVRRESSRIFDALSWLAAAIFRSQMALCTQIWWRVRLLEVSWRSGWKPSPSLDKRMKGEGGGRVTTEHVLGCYKHESVPGVKLVTVSTLVRSTVTVWESLFTESSFWKKIRCVKSRIFSKYDFLVQ